jgi:hypothetical protein
MAGGGYLISQAGGTGTVTANSASGGVPKPRHASIAGPAVRGPAPKVPPVYRVISTDTNFLAATLGAQAKSELSSPGASPATSPPLTLQACVMTVEGSDSVVLVDQARYQGKPVFVLVADDHAWVTGRDCTAAHPDVLESVSLPRP